MTNILLNNNILLISTSIIIISYLLLLIVNKLYNVNIVYNNINLYGSLQVKRYALIISIFILYMSILLYYIMNNNIGIQYYTNIYNIILGIDSINIYFIMLIGIILPISIISGWYFRSIHNNLYHILVLGIGILLLLNFICMDLLSFYILFESTLIPLFILIGIYGSSNKESAAYYVLLYTLFGSLFMLISICVTSYLLNNTTYYLYSGLIMSIDIQIILWLGFFIAIMIKSPLYPLHIWLPIVHSESPLAGSIILASLVLKLTVYLIIRWILPILPESTLIYSPFIYIIGLLTIIIVSLITIVQVDMKVIIAYSSVSHMAVTILGVFSNNIIGIEGSYILSIAHGLVSPGLFICIGGILYDRYHTRILYYYNGLLSIMPVFSLYFIILSFANIGTPLSANFVGEFLSLYGAFKSSPIIIAFAVSSVLLSAIYQFKLTNRITGGVPYYIANIGDINKRESLMLIVIILITLLIGIYPNFILKSLYYNISTLIYTL